MLKIGNNNNRTDWENYFSQSVIKNCDIKIYILDTNQELIADKNNIVSFTNRMSSIYVPSSMYVDEITFKIIGWSSLSDDIKTKLVNKTRKIDVHYYVNDQYTYTSSYKTYYVQSCKVDRKGQYAEIKAVNYIYNETNVGSNSVGGTDQPYSSSGNVSTAEYKQLTALKQAKGFISGYFEPPSYSWTYARDYNFTKYKAFDPNTADGNFDGKNIIDDYDIYYDDAGKENIVVYGAVVDSDTQTETKSATISANRTTYLYPKGQAIQIVSASILIGSITYPLSVESKYTDRCILYTSSISYNTGTLTVVYKNINTKNVDENSNFYIETYAIQDGDTSQQSIFRGYYSNKRMIEFDCRIDPSIEPLDIINLSVYNTTYKIAVEEATINFNGGFTGHIKARILEGFEPPVVVSINFNNNSFVVSNPNNKQKTLSVIYSQGTIDLTMSANSTLTIDDDNCHDIGVSIYEYSQHTLMTDVVIKFEDTNSVIVLEANG